VTGEKRGREDSESDFLWESLPRRVKESEIAPNYHDYHGNFDAEIFEEIFTDLCNTLERRYGSCHIHLDGAK
jgi:hypothetical protein